jgi:molybdopterin converting factor small subunit
MKVKVLFFGATAEAAGIHSQEFEVSDGARSREIFDRVLGEYPSLSSHKLLFSVNQEYANGSETVKDNDELAVFTAVSGG